MAFKSIETMYAGHRFRSRLEARWAVVFDALGLKWRYEVEGFEEDGFRYLPDFHLPDAQAWVEVKGDPAWPSSEAGRELLFRLEHGENPAAGRLPLRFALPLPLPYRGGQVDDVEREG